MQLSVAFLGAYGVQHIVLHAENVHQRETVAVAVGFDGVREGNITGGLTRTAEEHQNFVRYPLLTARHILTNPR